jgi:hypothetical protein
MVVMTAVSFFAPMAMSRCTPVACASHTGSCSDVRVTLEPTSSETDVDRTLMRFYCGKGEYNHLASLMLVPGEVCVVDVVILHVVTVHASLWCCHDTMLTCHNCTQRLVSTHHSLTHSLQR